MKKRVPVFLFDIDGVLVHPAGYRRSVEAVMRTIFPQEKIKPILPDELTQAVFEAHQITSEWDMVAISTILTINQISRSDPEIKIPSKVGQFAELEIAKPINPIDYPRFLSQLNTIEANGHASERLYQLVLQDQAGILFTQRLRDSKIMDILLNTRDVFLSETTSLFQNFCLGSKVFEETYGLSPKVETKSLLDKFDKPLISAENAKFIKALMNQNQINLAVITARPSQCAAMHSLSCAPEAELALKIARLPYIPLLGLGQLEWFAKHKEITVSELLKPSPFHALAAIFAALNFDVMEAMELAWEIIKARNSTSGPIKLLNDLCCVIFEDTSSGIKSLQSAKNILFEKGAQLTTEYYGISGNQSKIQALQAFKAEIFGSTEQAVHHALQVQGCV
jgi:hypothetical protein